MNTKIFCDIADLNVIKKFNKKKIVKGFTTNPSLMRKAGAKDYKLYSKKILKILLRILPIQTTPWDSFSIKKYDFNHVPITNPETFKLKSYAKSLNDILRLSKLPSCNNN